MTAAESAPSLNPDQLSAVSLLAEGLLDAQIAAALDINQSKLKRLMTAARNAVAVDTSRSLVYKVLRAGLIQPSHAQSIDPDILTPLQHDVWRLLPLDVTQSSLPAAIATRLNLTAGKIRPVLGAIKRIGGVELPACVRIGYEHGLLADDEELVIRVPPARRLQRPHRSTSALTPLPAPARAPRPDPFNLLPRDLAALRPGHTTISTGWRPARILTLRLHDARELLARVAPDDAGPTIIDPYARNVRLLIAPSTVSEGRPRCGSLARPGYRPPLPRSAVPSGDAPYWLLPSFLPPWNYSVLTPLLGGIAT